MLLTVDIGNTNIVFGLYTQGLLTHKWRLISDTKKSVDDYGVDIVENFLSQKVDCLQLSGCIVASVVPRLSEIVCEAISKFFDGEIFLIGSENTKLNITITLEKPSEIGADRLINSIAATKEFGPKLIIIDFGTATTFDVVGADGEYLGGVISPGINLSLKALHEMTAKLPKISLQKQKNVIGKNTVEAMNSGLYFGYLSLIEGMVARIETELNFKTTKIITGGLAEIFKEELPNYHHRPELTLEGLRIVYEDNKK